jgi:hypothetical protein
MWRIVRSWYLTWCCFLAREQIQEVEKQKQWCAVEAAEEGRALWGTFSGPMPDLRSRQRGEGGPGARSSSSC